MMTEPMLAKLTSIHVKLTGNWIIEPKFDGERIIAIRDGLKIGLWTRRHIQVAYKFPEIIESLKKIKDHHWILDGELTISGGFRRLLKRNVEDKIKIDILSRRIPATYHIFDIIQWDKEDLSQTTLVRRKKLLIDNIKPFDRIRIVPFQIVANSTLKKQFEAYVNQGYEGAVLKNAVSTYEAGKRSGEWLKIKKEETADVYVIGATKSTGSIPFGALILEKDGKYFGKVGTGFSDQERSEILNYLKENRGPQRETIPPKLNSDVLITTKPLLAEIKELEEIKGKPRAPVWLRFRWM